MQINNQSRKEKNIQKAKHKRKFFNYSEEQLKQALYEIREHKMRIRQASREFGVLKTPIQDYLRGTIPKISRKIRKTGPEPLLTIEGEEKICNWTIDLVKCGFPIKIGDLIATVEGIIKATNKQHLFKNGKPGKSGIEFFLKRHPEISHREAEDINRARAIVTEESIRSWFRELKTFLTNNDYMDILKDPNRSQIVSTNILPMVFTNCC